MAIQKSLVSRWTDYQAPKTVVFWACAASVVATLIVGFGWGGWVRGGTAQDMATKAATDARAELAASVCVYDFLNGANAQTQLTSFQGTDSWKRSTFLEEGGWVTPRGTDKPVYGAASLCAQQLMDAKAAPVKAAGTTG